MYLSSNTQGLTGRVWNRALAGVAGASLAGVARVAQIGKVWAGVDDHEQPLDAARIARSAELFVAALRDDSNIEMDWLWLATKVVREHERRYCLKRALLINPHSEIAKRGLATLRPLPDHILRLRGEK